MNGSNTITILMAQEIAKGLDKMIANDYTILSMTSKDY
jgi:hypothetical protein